VAAPVAAVAGVTSRELAPVAAPVAAVAGVTSRELAPVAAPVAAPANAAGAALQVTAQVFNVPLLQLTPMELMAYSVLQHGIPSPPLHTNHITNPTVTQFKSMTHGGGNFSKTWVSSREVEVKLDENKLAMWPVKESYRKKIAIVAEFLERSEIEKSVQGLLHPLLRFSCVKMQTAVRNELVQKVYGHGKNPEFLFRQFLCSLSIRSRVVHEGYTWCFDPESWNRASYRLMPGCDSKGKPRVTFV
jgi:hypothetical protein